MLVITKRGLSFGFFSSSQAKIRDIPVNHRKRH